MSKQKNNKPLIFSENAQFFAEACKKFIKYSRPSNNSSYILCHTYCNLIILHAAFFSDPIVCYLGFLAAISNTQIVQWTWLCTPDRLPGIRVILPHLKLAYFRNKLAFSTRYTNQITPIHQYAFPGDTALHFIITHILSSKFMHRIGSVMF